MPGVKNIIVNLLTQSFPKKLFNFVNEKV